MKMKSIHTNSSRLFGTKLTQWILPSKLQKSQNTTNWDAANLDQVDYHKSMSRNHNYFRIRSVVNKVHSIML